MCLILKTFMYALSFHWPCDLPEVKGITHLLKQRSVNWGSVRKYQMEKVLPASPSFIKLQNVTDFPWFLGGRSCSFPPYSCASLFLELCPARGKSRKKNPRYSLTPFCIFHININWLWRVWNQAWEEDIKVEFISHTTLCIKKLNAWIWARLSSEAAETYRDLQGGLIQSLRHLCWDKMNYTLKMPISPHKGSLEWRAQT